jgi:hypothetical protein
VTEITEKKPETSRQKKCPAEGVAELNFDS